MSAPSGIIAAMLPAINSILSVRDSVGAVIEPVFIVTRTWYTDAGKTIPADQPEGFATDSVVPLLPSPGMKRFSQDVRLREAGAIRAGDIILTNVSKASYKDSDLDGSTPNKGISKYYMIGVKLYQVINVTERYVTFDVQVRELTNQTRY